ncbi:MAG: hypothetical protein KJ771_08825 [Nanoarchaeota archaeon]|nr:hypothetical protein [Nanoarchaeota archaeon]
MKKLIIGSAIGVFMIILIFVGIASYTTYYGSLSESEELQKSQQIKSTQQKIDEDFYQSQQEKNQKIGQLDSQTEQEEREFIESQNQQAELIKQAENAAKYKDEDGDGLTFAEEEKLGTSDNSKDSDLDGVPDPEDLHPAGGGENYKFSVNWETGGYQHITSFGIPSDRYQWYKQMPRGWCCEGWNKFATYTDPTIQSIAEDITDYSKGSSCLYCSAIDFVESMIYQKDIDFNSNPEYPKYAIETIVDHKGDCEDTSFLMVAVLKALNIDSVILIYSDHAAVGVACNGCSGTYYNYRGKKFYFLESTSAPGQWELGQIWGKYGSETPKIIDIY